MPVYEYECKSCKKNIEVMQRFDEPPLITCESCGGELRKLISNTTFVLKGNGWYITDYARKSTGSFEASEAKKDGSSDKASGESKKTDTVESTSTKTEASSSVGAS